MISRNIVFIKSKVAKLIEQTVNDPKENEVQVKLSHSTISSGTERANLIGNKSIAWDLPEAEGVVFPRKVGYSSSGIILKVGANVCDFKVGDRVALSWSSHSEILNMNIKNVYKLDDDISFSDGAMAHIATFPLAAIRKCRLEIGESAIVMGMGILGVFALQLLKAGGATPIIAVDPEPTKRKMALEIGADYALDPYSPTFAQQVKELTNGGAKVGIEVTGVSAGLSGILDCIARFGRVALLGCTRDSNFTIDYYRKVHGPGITLIGAHTHARPLFDSTNGWWTERDDFETILKLTKHKRLKLSDLVEETHSPISAEEIFTRLCNEKAFPIVQFDWNKLNEKD